MFHKLLADSDELIHTTMELSSTQNEPSAAGISLVVLLAYVLFVALALVAMWRLFTKAGQPGWAALIPIYNSYVLIKIAGRPWWWLLLLLVPFLNIVISIIIGIDVAQRFGKGPVFGAALCGLLGIGYIILGFDKSQYQGDAAALRTV